MIQLHHHLQESKRILFELGLSLLSDMPIAVQTCHLPLGINAAYANFVGNTIFIPHDATRGWRSDHLIAVASTLDRELARAFFNRYGKGLDYLIETILSIGSYVAPSRMVMHQAAKELTAEILEGPWEQRTAGVMSLRSPLATLYKKAMGLEQERALCFQYLAANARGPPYVEYLLKTIRRFDNPCHQTYAHCDQFFPREGLKRFRYSLKRLDRF